MTLSAVHSPHHTRRATVTKASGRRPRSLTPRHRPVCMEPRPLLGALHPSGLGPGTLRGWADGCFGAPSRAISASALGRKGESAAFGCSRSAGAVSVASIAIPCAFSTRRPTVRRRLPASSFRVDQSLAPETAGRQQWVAAGIRPPNPNGRIQSKGATQASSLASSVSIQLAAGHVAGIMRQQAASAPTDD